MHRAVKLLSIVAAAGMFLVLIMGATVTNTGSGEGCGRSWPLCHGRFIPEFAVATLIEFSHRAVTGVEGILVLALFVGVWMLYRQHWEIRWLAPLMAFTLVLQALMGAWAVLYPQSPWVMASHFGISLLCLASTTLIATFVHQADRIQEWRAHPAPPGFGRAVWALLLFVMVVVYVGAYVRHTNAQMACIDWPLCNGSLFPGFAGPVGVVFLHRLGAVVATLGVVGLVLWARRFRDARPDLYWGSVVALGLILLQSLSGALVVFTRLNLFSALSHAAVMSLLFVALSYLCLHVLPRREAVASRATAPAHLPA